MRKIRLKASYGFVGTDREEEIEVEDDTTDDQLDEMARDHALERVEWYWEEIKDGESSDEQA